MATRQGSVPRVRTEDVVLEAGDQRVEAYVVGSATGEPGAGALFLHWLGEHHNDRSQFLSEARSLAREGVRSVLPAGRLPWQLPPTDAASDAANIEIEVARQAAALDRLAAGLPADAPIALVGHDFGAMSGSLLLGRRPRIGSAVLIALSPRWADWFLPFWTIEGDPFDYARALAPLDPIAAVKTADIPMLLQFSRCDYYIAPMSAVRLQRATKRQSTLEWYDSDHAMRSAGPRLPSRLPPPRARSRLKRSLA
jgi:pimeloyl-ACP methyl ester carboxylesterase